MTTHSEKDLRKKSHNVTRKDVDRGSANPRIQCSVCGKWMRLYGQVPNRYNGGKIERTQIFYGGCSYSNGDHLAGDKQDVCDNCCHIECKKISEIANAVH